MKKTSPPIFAYTLLYIISFTMAFIGLSINIKSNKLHEATQPVTNTLKILTKENEELALKLKNIHTLPFLEKKATLLGLSTIKQTHYVNETSR
eukprot:COSAG01_NODE_7_length_54400_cov_1218.054935_20_plen_93_part_00